MWLDNLSTLIIPFQPKPIPINSGLCRNVFRFVSCIFLRCCSLIVEICFFFRFKILNIAVFSVLPFSYSLVAILGVVFSALLFLSASNLLHITDYYRIWFEKCGYIAITSLYIIALIIFVLNEVVPIALVSTVLGFKCVLNTNYRSRFTAVLQQWPTCMNWSFIKPS